jgi:hypothetical protein
MFAFVCAFVSVCLCACACYCVCENVSTIVLALPFLDELTLASKTNSHLKMIIMMIMMMQGCHMHCHLSGC